jgi:hypothetical protein
LADYLALNSKSKFELNQSLYLKGKVFMETVTISASISEKKKVEFFQTMESLTGLVENQCNDLEIRVKDDNNLIIKIIFDGKDQMEKNFYTGEFNILKGTVKSLCNNVKINMNDSPVNKSYMATLKKKFLKSHWKEF